MQKLIHSINQKHTKTMKIENISNYVLTVSSEARKDMIAGQWDEVMTDGLYAACEAVTSEEMAQARDIAATEAENIAKKYPRITW